MVLRCLSCNPQLYSDVLISLVFYLRSIKAMRCCEDDPRADDSPAADDPEVSLVEKGGVSGLAKDNLPRPGPRTGLLAIHDPDAT